MQCFLPYLSQYFMDTSVVLDLKFFLAGNPCPSCLIFFFYMLPYHELTYYCDAKHGAGLAKF